jgi:tetratricopeptide (TPR) repeat protein
MKKISLYVTLSLLAGVVPALAGPGSSKPTKTGSLTNFSRIVKAAYAVPAQGGGSVWKSQEEYNTYQTMNAEKDAKKKIELAEAFLQKFADSAVKNYVYAAMMNAYQQLGDTTKAVETARKVMESDANNLDALRYLSFVFPFTFKLDSADATSELSRAESDARHGLEVLGKLAKPANVSEEQFNQAIKPVRDIFNNAVGFVALQRKDYPGAITSFKAALEDNPSDLYAAYRMGVAYLLSTPPDYNNGFWYLSRAVALGKTSNTSDTAGIEKYLNQAYVNYHGNMEGLSDIIAQAATSPNPPADFEVAVLKPPAPTGNPNIDNFNKVTFPLRLGGSRAEQAWAQLKGQPLGLGGYVNSVEKSEDAGAYVVRIALDQAKASSGYDIELKDSTQSKAADLGEGDPVRFQGNISAYTSTPTFSLTLDQGKINDDDLEAASAKAKTGPRRKKTGK